MGWGCSGKVADGVRQIQLACDDLYCSPLDHTMQARARALLQALADGSPRAYARRIRIACDELHDDPTNTDAQYALLLLLGAADVSDSSPRSHSS